MLTEYSTYHVNQLPILQKVRKLALFLFSIVIFGLNSSFKLVEKKAKFAIKTVVIDAGHGGHDTGCLGSSTREKDMALKVALKLGKLIEDNFGEVDVVYTRKTDTFIELHKRAEIANKNNADLFICIHFNSGGKTAYGAETYAMGLHKSADNLEVAKRENSSILQEQDYLKKYDGFDPNSEEATIIFSLYQNANLDQSLAFASKIQEKFKKTGRFDRGVKQAGFLVLWRTNMPAVLIESGFLTNKDEQAYFKSGNGINKTAVSIFKAFREYKAQSEGETIPKDDDPFLGQEEMGKLETYKTAEAEPSEKKEINPETTEVPDSFKLRNLKSDSLQAKKMSKTELEEYKQELQKEKLKTEMEIAELKLKKGIKDPVTPVNEVKPVNPIPAEGVCYRVQFYSSGQQMSLNSPKFKGLDQIFEYSDKGMYKYTTGMFDNFAEALKFQGMVRKAGFADAFVVGLNGNKRITVDEAKKALGK